jgi:hypothetical protein
MTAEGDNRVLMLKIVKDLMTNLKNKKSTLPKPSMCPKTELPHVSDLTEITVLLDLLKIKEVMIYSELVMQMTNKAKEEKKTTY